MRAAKAGRAGWSRAIHTVTLSTLGLLPLAVGCVATTDEPADRDTIVMGNEPGSGCTEGQQDSCPCGGGLPDGIQVCNAQNVWDACQCGTAGTGGADGTGGGAMGTGSTGPGTGGATGGSANSTGGMTSTDACATSVSDMVSDMEIEVPNMPPMLNMHETRQGPWYSDSGSGASITGANTLDAAIDGGRCTSARAVHAAGDSAATHSVFGFDFDSTGGMKEAYSLEGAGTGIAFFAKGSGTLRLEVPTTDLDPAFDCAGDEPPCYGFHGALVELPAEWTLIEVPFSSLEQQPWSASVQEVALDLSNAIGVQFQLQGEADAWIDDIGFY